MHQTLLDSPASQYGTVAKTQNRFNNVLQPFIPYGAKLEDPANALLSEIFNLDATGTNDVGWEFSQVTTIAFAPVECKCYQCRLLEYLYCRYNLHVWSFCERL